jgi:STE24 endopeptidase
VVLYDTLVRGFPREQVRVVVAHELGHQRDNDLQGGLLYLALVAPVGLWAAARWVRYAAPAGGPAAIPVLALAVVVLSTGIGWVSNQLSRDVEARADQTSLELTRDPAAFEAFHRGLALSNLSDPDPPAWQEALLATHPSTVERLAAGVRFRARAAAASPEAP